MPRLLHSSAVLPESDLRA